MGEYYVYVNDTKRSYFFIDPTMTEIKRSFVGRNIGSRILSLLLLQNNADYTGLPDHPLFGSWIGDSFYITADDYATDFVVSETSYKNIGQDVIEMVAVSDPFDLFRFGGRAWTINMVEEESEYFKITQRMAERMLDAFGDEHRRFPDEELERLIAALKRIQSNFD